MWSYLGGEGESTSGRGNSEDKGPEAEAGIVKSRKNEKPGQFEQVSKGES